MRPGLSRAVPMGILGFLVGMVILVVMRTLQGLQPVMEPELAFVLGTFLASGFFIYGLGAFDPRMNVHAHEPEPGEEAHDIVVHEEEAQEEEEPGQILGGYLWLLSSILLGVLLVIVIFALLPGGPALQITSDPLSSALAVGFVEIELGGQVYAISQLTLLVGFVVIMFVSLAVAAGAIGMLFYTLNRGMTAVQTVDHTPLEAEPLERVSLAGSGMVRWIIAAVVVTLGFAVFDLLIGNPITNEFATLSFCLAAGGVFALSFLLLGFIIRFVAGQQWLWLVRALVILLVLGFVLGVVDFVVIWEMLSGLPLVPIAIFNLIILIALIALRVPAAAGFAMLAGVLLPLFYFVLIGIVVPFEPLILFGISATNALLVAALIIRPKFLTHWVGYGARWTATQLRRLPNALQ